MERFSPGVAAETPRANIGSKSAISVYQGPVDPKFRVERVASNNHFSSQKTRLNALSYGKKMWTDLFPFCHNSRVCQTDSRTEFSSLDRRRHSMQRGEKGADC